jgi:bifunctional DNase/RNase
VGDEREVGLVEMVVESVRVQTSSSQHVVILKQVGRERYLPIWIGPWEAQAIAMRLQGMSPERPLTHDTFSTTLDALGVEIRRVVIADLADETFHARIHLTSGDREIEIDSRPSDALALAVRGGVRIFAAPRVLARAGVVPEADDDDGSPARERAAGRAKATLSGEALERTGERVPDEELDLFRDFVNSLEVEGERREGPTEPGGKDAAGGGGTGPEPA